MPLPQSPGAPILCGVPGLAYDVKRLDGAQRALYRTSVRKGNSKAFALMCATQCPPGGVFADERWRLSDESKSFRRNVPPGKYQTGLARYPGDPRPAGAVEGARRRKARGGTPRGRRPRSREGRGTADPGSREGRGAGRKAGIAVGAPQERARHRPHLQGRGRSAQALRPSSEEVERARRRGGSGSLPPGERSPNLRPGGVSRNQEGTQREVELVRSGLEPAPRVG